MERKTEENLEKTVLEEAGKCGKTREKIKGWQATVMWRCFKKA
jgi:hypothetical protein